MDYIFLNTKPIYILNTKIHPIRLTELLDYICQVITTNQKAIIANVNVFALNLAFELPWFREIVNKCDLVFCDGYGVKWAARFLGYTIPERFTPPDWIDDLANLCSTNQYTLYFLGAKPGIAEIAIQKLSYDYPNLKIVGYHHGYFDKNVSSNENLFIRNEINSLKPNILILGFGMPLQEQWLSENWLDLDVNIALPAGALFDYVSGHIYRAPKWMTNYGLEWLGRLMIEPRRLWKRYILGNPIFIWRILLEKFGLLHLPQNNSQKGQAYEKPMD